MDRPDLDAIEARANAATPGPWERDEDSPYCITPPWSCKDVATANRKENADFIAHAREDIPALLAYVRELEALLGRIAKYAREDRARTPGTTRLARALAEVPEELTP